MIAGVHQALRDALDGRPVLFAGQVARAFRRWAVQLRDAGLARPLIVAAAAGGDPPLPDEADWCTLPPEHRRREPLGARMAHLPEPVAERLAAHDPHGEAVVITHLRSGITHVHGRAAWFEEPDGFRQVERKAAADAWFDRAGVPRAPSWVGALDDPDLQEHSRRLDQGAGTAWSGDHRDRPSGGATLVRRVRSAAEARQARAELAEACDQVRLMPFVEGVPCGINAVVLPDGVAVARPLEMVVLRRGQRLRYFGCASFWDPAPEHRDALVAAARRVGRCLQRTLGYAGVFTVDGIMGRSGFVPTEINTRAGEGFTMLSGLDPTLPLGLVDQLLRAGHAPGVGAEVLEGALVDLADGHRTGFARWRVEQPWEGDRELRVAWDGAAYRPAPEGEPGHGSLWRHAMQPGGFLRFVPDPEHVPRGPPAAPRLAAGLALADGLFGLGLGPLGADLGGAQGS